MTVEVNTQTIGHILIQYSAFLAFMSFLLYDGLIHRRLGRPLSILWVLVCAGQLIKCTNKYIALEAWDTLSAGEQEVVDFIFAVDGIFMATCLYAMTMLYHFGAHKADYARFVSRGLKIYVPLIVLVAVAGMFAVKATGAHLEHYGNLHLVLGYYVHLGYFHWIGLSKGWFKQGTHRVTAVVAQILLLSYVVFFLCLAEDFHVELVLTASLLPVALNYVTYSVSVRALAQLPELRPPEREQHTATAPDATPAPP